MGDTCHIITIFGIIINPNLKKNIYMSKNPSTIQWNAAKWFSLSLIGCFLVALLLHTFEVVGDNGAKLVFAILGVVPIYFAVRFVKHTFFGKQGGGDSTF